MGNSSILSTWKSFTPQLQALLRIVAAIMFTMSGTMILFAWPMSVPKDNETVELISQAGIGGILQFTGGILLIVGLFTRPVAFILAGEMAVAYFQFHAPSGIWPIINGGTDAVLYCFIWLFFSAAGAGAWSIDNELKKR